MTGTRTPYSDQWREHTRERMHALNIGATELAKHAGMSRSAVRSAMELAGIDVGLETVGPIDEALDSLEASSEAYALEHGGRKLEAVHHNGTRHRVERVAVKLDRLTNMDGEVQQ